MPRSSTPRRVAVTGVGLVSPLGIGNAENWFAGSSVDGAGPYGPCAINCTNAAGLGTYSFHPGGVHVLLCDGSVHFLNENADIGVFVNLVTYHGGVNTPSL